MLERGAVDGISRRSAFDLSVWPIAAGPTEDGCIRVVRVAFTS